MKEKENIDITAEEVWKDIAGYEGLYQVSSAGKVRSLDRVSMYPNGVEYHRKGRIMKPKYGKLGYLRIMLYDRQGNRSIKFIHKLVASAFIPNPSNLSQVNHKDEIKHHNCVDNLEWCTRQYNMNYGSRTRRASLAESYPVLQFSKYGDFIKEWDSASEAYRKTGISRSGINACCRRERNTAGGYCWRWKKDFNTTPIHLNDGYSAVRSTCKAVVQYTKTGNIVKEYVGVGFAAKENRFSQANISAACNGRKKYAYGYIWRYKEDIEEAM